MNQIIIGNFIAQKRRELNLTQEQLSEKVGVTSKSVSKWETGKCLPDYSIIEILCKTLNISISELLDGEENEKENIRTYDDRQMLELMERISRLEKGNQTLMGAMLIVSGMALFVLSNSVGGSSIQEFLSGVILGISVGVMLVGVYTMARTLSKLVK